MHNVAARVRTREQVDERGAASREQEARARFRESLSPLSWPAAMFAAGAESKSLAHMHSVTASLPRPLFLLELLDPAQNSKSSRSFFPPAAAPPPFVWTTGTAGARTCGCAGGRGAEEAEEVCAHVHDEESVRRAGAGGDEEKEGEGSAPSSGFELALDPDGGAKRSADAPPASPAPSPAGSSSSKSRSCEQGGNESAGRLRCGRGGPSERDKDARSRPSGPAAPS